MNRTADTLHWGACLFLVGSLTGGCKLLANGSTTVKTREGDLSGYDSRSTFTGITSETPLDTLYLVIPHPSLPREDRVDPRDAQALQNFYNRAAAAEKSVALNFFPPANGTVYVLFRMTDFIREGLSQDSTGTQLDGAVAALSGGWILKDDAFTTEKTRIPWIPSPLWGILTERQRNVMLANVGAKFGTAARTFDAVDSYERGRAMSFKGFSHRSLSGFHLGPSGLYSLPQGNLREHDTDCEVTSVKVESKKNAFHLKAYVPKILPPKARIQGSEFKAVQYPDSKTLLNRFVAEQLDGVMAQVSVKGDGFYSTPTRVPPSTNTAKNKLCLPRVEVTFDYDHNRNKIRTRRPLTFLLDVYHPASGVYPSGRLGDVEFARLPALGGATLQATPWIPVETLHADHLVLSEGGQFEQGRKAGLEGLDKAMKSATSEAAKAALLMRRKQELDFKNCLVDYLMLPDAEREAREKAAPQLELEMHAIEWCRRPR